MRRGLSGAGAGPGVGDGNGLSSLERPGCSKCSRSGFSVVEDDELFESAGDGLLEGPPVGIGLVPVPAAASKDVAGAFAGGGSLTVRLLSLPMACAEPLPAGGEIILSNFF